MLTKRRLGTLSMLSRSVFSQCLIVSVSCCYLIMRNAISAIIYFDYFLIRFMQLMKKTRNQVLDALRV